MISLSSKTVSKITKIGLAVVFVYSAGFLFYKTVNYYQTYQKKEEILKELQMRKNETNSLKRKIELNKNRIETLKKQYITKDELDVKIRDIFKRMSVLDYNLKFLDSKKMCIDRYIIVTQLTAQSEKGIKAGEGILSYIGKMKKSDKTPSIYFVDYTTKQKEVK